MISGFSRYGYSLQPVIPRLSEPKARMWSHLQFWLNYKSPITKLPIESNSNGIHLANPPAPDLLPIRPQQ
jgi:hypothetical protein